MRGWKTTSELTDWIVVLLSFFMLMTGYGMTAGFMEWDMALIYHAGLEKWAFFGMLVAHVIISELGAKSYRVLARNKGDTACWMAVCREVSLWGMLASASLMVATGLARDFGLHKELDWAFLALLLIHTLAGFFFYIKGKKCAED